MTKQEQLAAFLDQNITFPRDTYPVSWRVPMAARPAAEDIAQELLAMAEFRALKLGTWLLTPDGQFLAEAVELVTPPFYRADVELLIDALQIAAKQQHREGRNLALAVAALALFAIALGITTD